SDTAHFVISRVARSCCHPGLRGPLAAGALPEPKLQHRQSPEAMPMVAGAVAVLAPKRRDGAVIEHAAIAQLSVEQQRVHHRRKRAAQPFAGRRLDRKSTRLNSSHVSISYAVF